MTDAMKWFCANYILPHAEAQATDFGQKMALDCVQNELPRSLFPQLETVKEFYALQGFRLGLKLGAALGEEFDRDNQKNFSVPSCKTERGSI